MATVSESLSDLVRYSAWASKKLLAFSLTVPDEVITRAIPNSHGGILKTFQHIYYGDRAWLSRLEQRAGVFEDPPPGPSLNDLDRDWWPLLDRLSSFAALRDPEERTTFK
ncbi:MAG: hypothetical protein M3N54_03610, partial [Acidobacteriota bacterium]|nr:hypothetical protein [Acidobacteriota bacterium]